MSNSTTARLQAKQKQKAEERARMEEQQRRAFDARERLRNENVVADETRRVSDNKQIAKQKTSLLRHVADQMMKACIEQENSSSPEEIRQLDQRLHALNETGESLKQEIDLLTRPILVWQADREDIKEYIRATHTRRVAALQKDRTLAVMIASLLRLTSATANVQSDDDYRLMQEQIAKKTSEIEDLVRPSVAAGGDGVRKTLKVPEAIQNPIENVLKYFQKLQDSRLEHLTKASPEKLKEFDQGAITFDEMLQELLTELTRACDFRDDSQFRDDDVEKRKQTELLQKQEDADRAMRELLELDETEKAAAGSRQLSKARKKLAADTRKDDEPWNWWHGQKRPDRYTAWQKALDEANEHLDASWRGERQPDRYKAWVQDRKPEDEQYDSLLRRVAAMQAALDASAGSAARPGHAARRSRRRPDGRPYVTVHVLSSTARKSADGREYHIALTPGQSLAAEIERLVPVSQWSALTSTTPLNVAMIPNLNWKRTVPGDGHTLIDAWRDRVLALEEWPWHNAAKAHNLSYVVEEWASAPLRCHLLLYVADARGP